MSRKVKRRATARSRKPRRALRARSKRAATPAAQAIRRAAAETAVPSTSVPRLLTEKQVLERLAISRTHRWKLSCSGQFPPAIRIGRFALRWTEDSILHWLSERQASPGAAA